MQFTFSKIFKTFVFIVSIVFIVYWRFFKLRETAIDATELSNWLVAFGTIAAVFASVWQNVEQRKQYKAQLEDQDKKHREEINYNRSMAIFEMIMKADDRSQDMVSKYLDDQSKKNANQMYLACWNIVTDIINFSSSLDQRVFELLNRYVGSNLIRFMSTIMYKDIKGWSDQINISQEIYDNYKDMFLVGVIFQFNTLNYLISKEMHFKIALDNLIPAGKKYNNIKWDQAWERLFLNFKMLSDREREKLINDIVNATSLEGRAKYINDIINKAK